jgi:hypothetical protein
MPKIKITTERRPWIDGKPQAAGAMLDVDADTADMMVERGFAEKVRGAPKKAVLDDD